MELERLLPVLGVIEGLSNRLGEELGISTSNRLRLREVEEEVSKRFGSRDSLELSKNSSSFPEWISAIS